MGQKIDLMGVDAQKVNQNLPNSGLGPLGS